ncbi:MAG: tetratricopeptide repeat protein [Desulfomonilia bacterium]|nr:tetratricopeptide repeat protein [Deltaproteobacteria bacterium]
MAKTTRKDLLNAPDEFITTTRSAIQWIKENPTRFITLVTIVVVVLASGIGFYSWKTGREHSAMSALSNAGDNPQITADLVQSYADTKAGKLARLRLASLSYREKDPSTAIDHAQEFINTWGRKDIFHWQAILILTAAHLDRQQPERALEFLSNDLESPPENYRDQALFYKAHALMALGRHQEASETLARISESYHDIVLPTLASLEN